MRHSLPAAPLLAVLTSACVSLTDPALPSTATQLAPPAVYARWWGMTEGCSGRTGSMAEVSWFVVPGVETIEYDGEEVVGYWSRASNRIVFAGGAMLRGDIVRHEMLHALVGAPGHARSLFLGSCRGVVACAGRCVSEGGPPPATPVNAAIVAPQAIEVQVGIAPATPSAAVDDGWFDLTVTARNPAPHPVVVRLDPGPDRRASTFAFELRTGGAALQSAEVEFEVADLVFLAGETKRRVFDVRVGDELWELRPPPGQYEVRPAYGERWGAARSFVIR